MPGAIPKLGGHELPAPRSRDRRRSAAAARRSGVAFARGSTSVYSDLSGRDAHILTGKIHAWGGVAGAGVEYRFSRHVSLRAEGLHYFFDKTTSFCGSIDCSLMHDGLRSISVFHVGINALFGDEFVGKGKAPVVARY